MMIDQLAYRPVDQIQLNYLRLKIFHSLCRTNKMPSAGYLRVIYIFRGTGQFRVAGKTQEAQERSLVYIPRDEEYQSTWLTESEFAVMDIDLRDQDGKALSLGDEAGVLFRDEHHLYEGNFRAIAEAEEDDAPYRWMERISLALRLYCEIARDRVIRQEGPHSPRIYNALVYLENNYAQNTPVEELARMCALSLSSFRKLFFEAKGMPPVDYRNALRVRRAAELLRSGMKVGEAASAVGVEDVKYFSKLFRRYTGMPPSHMHRPAEE